ncbi:SHOCT domain-containing protein [Halosimplex aquaticum]
MRSAPTRIARALTGVSATPDPRGGPCPLVPDNNRFQRVVGTVAYGPPAAGRYRGGRRDPDAPARLLAGLFVSFEAAAVVFIVGWFLLTPLIPIVGNEIWPALRDRSGSSDESAEESPLEELKARYARGEIDDAEFERRMERLVEVEDGRAGGSANRTERAVDGTGVTTRRARRSARTGSRVARRGWRSRRS